MLFWLILSVMLWAAFAVGEEYRMHLRRRNKKEPSPPIPHLQPTPQTREDQRHSALLDGFTQKAVETRRKFESTQPTNPDEVRAWFRELSELHDLGLVSDAEFDRLANKALDAGVPF